jgi:hypothetical protein
MRTILPALAAGIALSVPAAVARPAFIRTRQYSANRVAE